MTTEQALLHEASWLQQFDDFNNGLYGHKYEDDDHLEDWIEVECEEIEDEDE